MRILLIEDNEALADATQEYFRQIGHPLDWTGSVEQAERTLNFNDFDLLILDINLPGRSGYQLLQSLRLAGNSIPVLILTARSQIDDRVSVCSIAFGVWASSKVYRRLAISSLVRTRSKFLINSSSNCTSRSLSSIGLPLMLT
jgi:CheY-like chemotaxis protein